MTVTLIEALAGRKADAKAKLAEIVRQLADGNFVDADEIVCVADSCGIDAEQVPQMVELLQRRRELRRTMDQGPELEIARRQVNDRLAKMDADENLRRAEFEKLRNVEHQREIEISRRSAEAKIARAELAGTAPKELRDEIARLNGQRTEAVEQRRELMRRAETAGADTAPGIDLHKRADELADRTQEIGIAIAELQARLLEP